MKRTIIAAVVVGFAAASGLFLSGCCHSPNFAYPRLDQPHGDIETQRKTYSQFDPFPDPNIGPGIPEFRPPDYKDPAREKGSVGRNWVKNDDNSRAYGGNFNSSAYGSACDSCAPPRR